MNLSAWHQMNLKMNLSAWHQMNLSQLVLDGVDGELGAVAQSQFP